MPFPFPGGLPDPAIGSPSLAGGFFTTEPPGKTLESLFDCKEIQPVHPRDQSWVFIGRTDVEAETPILQPPDTKN